MGDLGDVTFANIYIKLFTQSEKTIKLTLEEQLVNTVRISTGHPVSLLSRTFLENSEFFLST
jgi:hypothetical protein